MAPWCNACVVHLCADEGFGVGHTRSTQTKGVWVWGEPQPLPEEQGGAGGGQRAAIVYVDTEGFESTGKSDVYDDRIFALSAIMSSLLVSVLCVFWGAIVLSACSAPVLDSSATWSFLTRLNIACGPLHAAPCMSEPRTATGRSCLRRSTGAPGCCPQIYNLPETVRESDVEKLSFAVQLADGFYARPQARRGACKNPDPPLRPQHARRGSACRQQVPGNLGKPAAQGVDGS